MHNRFDRTYLRWIRHYTTLLTTLKTDGGKEVESCIRGQTVIRESDFAELAGTSSPKMDRLGSNLLIKI